MDPDAAFESLLGQIANKQYDEAEETAENLQEWLRKGGFAPGGGKYSRGVIVQFVDWAVSECRDLQKEGTE